MLWRAFPSPDAICPSPVAVELAISVRPINFLRLYLNIPDAVALPEKDIVIINFE